MKKEICTCREEGGKKRIGMLVAVEIDSVFAKYGDAQRVHDSYGFKVYEYELEKALLFVIHSGAGEIGAAAATQLLISEYHVCAVVNFGVVGGLTDEMKVARTVIADKVVHYDFDISAVDGLKVGQYAGFEDIFIPIDQELVERAVALEPELTRVTCASGDKFVGTEEAKRRLARDFGADICEMELAAIAMTCYRSKVPCLAIKTVSDGVDGGAAEFTRSVRRSGDICMHVVEKLIDVL